MSANKYVGKTCPYCKTVFKNNDVIVVCGTCDMPHHLSCWQENNGCTTFGCTGVIKDFVGAPESFSPPKNVTIQNPTTRPNLEMNSIPEPQKEPQEQIKKQDRFEILYEGVKNAIQENSPVIIESVSLIIDHTTEKLMARCSFKCITETPIIAMMVDVLCCDIWGNQLKTIEGFQFLDLKTKKGSIFGQTTPIDIPEKSTRSIGVLIKKIMLADRTTIECGEITCVFGEPQTLLNYYGNQNVADQYSRETTKKAKYVVKEYDNYWQCTCGSINPQTERVCSSCNSEKGRLIAILSDGAIIDRASTYHQLMLQKEEQERREQEERVRQAEEQVKREQEAKESEIRAAEKKAKKKKRRKKAFLIISITLVVLLGFAAVGYFYGIPLYKYNKAVDLLDAGQYDSAYDEFSKLHGFKDSNEMLDECKYQKACDRLTKKHYEQAVNLFNDISYYKNSKDKIDEAMYGYVTSNKNNWNRTTYSYLQTLKNKAYRDSASIFSELYSWKVTVVGWNSSNSTTNTKGQSSISKSQPVICHFELTGGPPSSSTVITVKGTLPNGNTTNYTFNNSWSNGSSGWYGWTEGIYTYPEYGATGTLSVRFYDSNGNLIGNDSIKITN